MNTEETRLRDDNNVVDSGKHSSGATSDVAALGGVRTPHTAPRITRVLEAPTAGSVAGRSLTFDAACAVAANGLACWAFSMTFDGSAFLVAALAGVLFGVAGATIARWRNVAWWVGVAITVMLVVVLGPAAALWKTTTFGIPTADSLSGLYDGAIHGWWRLLTLVPPIGDFQHLYAVPLVTGAIGGTVSMSVARSRRFGVAAVATPFLTLTAAIVVGTHDPASILVTGSAVAVVCALWAVNIDRRRRPIIGGNTKFRGLAGALAVAIVALGAGAALGERLPGVNAASRTVVRDKTLPPFDPAQYPSPLVGYRKFKLPAPNAGSAPGQATVEGSLKNEAIFSVEGLKSATRIRFATMDAYDGNVFRFASGDRNSAFRAIGETVRTTENAELRGTVVIDGLNGVWLPLFGQPTSIHFEGKNAAKLAASLRYNDRQRAAVTIEPTETGDRYVVSATSDKTPTQAQLCTVEVAPALVPLSGPLTEALAAANQAKLPEVVAAKLGSEPGTPKNCSDSMTKVFAAQEKVQRAFFDNGDGGAAKADKKASSGHYFGRLAFYLAKLPFGNEEQSAAAMASVLRAQGLDARVALGVVHDGSDSRVYTGNDVVAWVDVRTNEYGWVPFDVKPSQLDTPPDISSPPPKGETPDVTPPPPVVPPRTRNGTDDGLLDGSSSARVVPNVREQSSSRLDWVWKALKYVVAPVGVLVAPLVLIIGMKRRRRGRRRRHPVAAVNIAGGWLEMVDLLRDVGKPVPSFATRREIAYLSGLDEVPIVAAEVDGALFGAAEPDTAQSQAVWEQVDAQRVAVLKSMKRIDRVRATLNLASLRSDAPRDHQPA